MKSMSQILLLFSVVLILSFGQLLFKAGADRLPSWRGVGDLWAFALEWRLVVAVLMYGVGTVLWIIALQKTQLSSVHGIVALSFVLVPVLAMLFLGEKLNWANGVGAALIIVGVGIIVRFAP
jgi:undecaprenyl phosphate-alpha-L-ara4N flippase subunit ArnE